MEDEQDLVMDVDIIEDEGSYQPGETLKGSVVEEEVLFDIPNQEEKVKEINNNVSTSVNQEISLPKCLLTVEENKEDVNASFKVKIIKSDIEQGTNNTNVSPSPIKTEQTSQSANHIIVTLIQHPQPSSVAAILPKSEGLTTPIKKVEQAPHTPVLASTPNSESKEGMFDLPGGWRKKIVQRKSGISAGRYDVYLFSPENVKLRSKVEVVNYLQQTNSTMDINQLDFSKPDSGSPRKKRSLSPGSKANTLTPRPLAKKKKLDNSLASEGRGPETLNVREFTLFVNSHKKVPSSFDIPINSFSKKNGLLESAQLKIKPVESVHQAPSMKTTFLQKIKKNVFTNFATVINKARNSSDKKRPKPFQDLSVNIEINNGQNSDAEIIYNNDEEFVVERAQGSAENHNCVEVEQIEANNEENKNCDTSSSPQNEPSFTENNDSALTLSGDDSIIVLD